MGRRLSIDGVVVTFGTGTTMAFFHWEGTAPDDREAFMMSVIGRLSSKANILISMFGTLSGPTADLAFTRESLRHISLLVTAGTGRRAGRKAGSCHLSSAGREDAMGQKCALMTLAASSGVLFSILGNTTGLRMARFPLRTLAVLYHEVG